MKRLWLLSSFLALMFFSPAGAFALTDLTLGWDYPNPPTDFSHFVIQQHDGTDYVDMVSNINRGLRKWTLKGLADGTYSFRLLTFDDEGLADEAGAPTIIDVAVIDLTDGPPPPAINFRVITTLHIQVNEGKIIVLQSKLMV